MADILVASPNDQKAIRRFKDMGDGTFAELTAVAAAVGAAGYPSGATPLAGNATGANSACVVTLAAVAGKTNYLSGLQATGFGATAASAFNISIAGVVGGTISFAFVAPAGVAGVQLTPFTPSFVPPLVASAPNTAIVVTMNAVGAGNPGQNLSAQGFQI